MNDPAWPPPAPEDARLIALAGQPPVCGNCRHWHRLPDPPGPRDLAVPVQGQCRESPPAMTILPGPGGQQLNLVSYPNLPAGFPACSRFSLALVTA